MGGTGQRLVRPVVGLRSCGQGDDRLHTEGHAGWPLRGLELERNMANPALWRAAEGGRWLVTSLDFWATRADCPDTIQTFGHLSSSVSASTDSDFLHLQSPLQSIITS